MNRAILPVTAGAALIAGSLAIVYAQPADEESRRDRPGMAQQPGESAARPSLQECEAIISRWPSTSQKAAAQMIEKYGPPDGATATMIEWRNNGPWLSTIVYGEEVQHNFPMPHKDVLEQFVYYRAPLERYDELAAYDGSVIVERTKGVISARCDKEEMNILALNLAHDIAKGEKSVEEAREFYARTAKEFMQGQRDEYTQRLMFETTSGDTADPDRPAR